MKLKMLFAGLFALAAAPPAIAQVLSSDQVTGQPGAVQGTASDGKRVELPVYVPVRADGSVIDPAGGGTGASANQIQGNVADGATDLGNAVKIGGEFLTTLPTLTNGQRGAAMMSSRGELLVTPSIGGAAQTQITAGADAGSNTANTPLMGSRGQVWNGTTWDRQPGNTTGTFAIGNVASGATDAGNPVKVGGIYVAAPATLTSGQRTNLQTGSTGSLKVQIMGNDANTPIDYVGGGIDGASAAVNTLITGNYNRVFNGTGWDRQRGDTNGAYTVSQATTLASQGSLNSQIGNAICVSACNLYGLTLVSPASAGYFMLFNTITRPADGATTTTLVWCMPVAANTGLEINWRGTPKRMTTGASLAFSSTGCGTLTNVTLNFMAADYR